MLLRTGGELTGILRCKSNVCYCIKGTSRQWYEAYLAEPIPMPGKWHPVCFNMPQLTSQVTPPGGACWAELCCSTHHSNK